MTLRTRLFASLALVLLISFSLFGGAEYGAMRQGLLGEVDEALYLRAQSLAQQLRAGHLGPDDLAHLQLNTDPMVSGSLVYAEVISASGQVLLASDNLRGEHLPTPQLGEHFETVLARPDAPLRLFCLPVQDPGGRVLATVLVGESLEQVNHSLRASNRKILATGLLTLSLSLAAASAAMARGLAPLRKVAETAQRIVQTGDLSQAVVVPHGNDDIARVAISFNALLERASQVLEAQSQLLSDTSHELRNPLTVIQTDLDMLGRELDPATRAEIAEEASHEAARVIRLVEDLLLISWAESSPSIASQPVRLDTMASSVVARMKPLAAGRSLSAEGAEVWTLGDPDRFSQILRNLLDNAIRHTAAQGNIRVTVDRQAGRAVLRVQDDGTGIPPLHLGRLFERFYRVDSARSRALGGSGLGLSVARALARAYSGDITASSEVGQGATFTLSLPLFIESSSNPHDILS